MEDKNAKVYVFHMILGIRIIDWESHWEYPTNNHGRCSEEVRCEQESLLRGYLANPLFYG